MQTYTVEFLEKKSVAPDILEVRVRLVEPANMQFVAGQYVLFKIGEEGRYYSITTLPADANNELLFCIELVKGGLGSNFVLGLKPGDQFSLEGPEGVFTVNQFDRDIFFVATGVGIAPFKSMIADMLHRGYQGQATLLFGLRNEGKIFYYDEFEQLAAWYPNFKFLPILSQPSEKWEGLKGRVTNFLDQNYPEYSSRRFYVCGGQEVVRDVRALLIKKGHPLDEIKLEVF